MRLVDPRPLLVFAGLIGLAPLLSAQTTISGVVQDSATGGAIANAEILISTINRRTTTDGGGRFEVRNLPHGQHGVQIRAIGYRAKEETIETSGLRTTRVVFELASEAVRLDSVVVTERPSMRGVGAFGYEAFEERRRTRPSGIFIDSVDMRRNDVLDLTGVLRRMNVPMNRSGTAVVGRAAVRSFRQGNMDCPVAVYVDGIRIQLFRLRDYSASGIQAIEVYRSVAQVPPQFDRLDQECGVMLIWTRR